jgi:hypothetical protein
MAAPFSAAAGQRADGGAQTSAAPDEAKRPTSAQAIAA